MAIKETANSIFVALTGGTPLQGNVESGALGGTIGWGDLFFNFTGKNFTTANQQGSLYGVRFAANNDSKVGVGVYKNVTATSVATANHGYSSLKQYYDYGWGKQNTQGTDLATKQDAFNYFSTGTIQNVIGKGTKVGGINMLSATQLKAAGLDFQHFSANGTQTIGFEFSKALIGSGNYVSNIFLECGNDGVSLKGDLKATPEPATVAGLGVVALGLMGARRRKTNKQAISG